MFDERKRSIINKIELQFDEKKFFLFIFEDK